VENPRWGKKMPITLRPRCERGGAREEETCHRGRESRLRSERHGGGGYGKGESSGKNTGAQQFYPLALKSKAETTFKGKKPPLLL